MDAEIIGAGFENLTGRHGYAVLFCACSVKLADRLTNRGVWLIVRIDIYFVHKL